jgi:hypothetical protein
VRFFILFENNKPMIAPNKFFSPIRHRHGLLRSLTFCHLATAVESPSIHLLCYCKALNRCQLALTINSPPPLPFDHRDAAMEKHNSFFPAQVVDDVAIPFLCFFTAAPQWAPNVLA